MCDGVAQESMYIRGDDARAHPYRDRSRHLPMSPKVPMTPEGSSSLLVRRSESGEYCGIIEDHVL
jgi:hypothetical protein